MSSKTTDMTSEVIQSLATIRIIVAFWVLFENSGSVGGVSVTPVGRESSPDRTCETGEEPDEKMRKAQLDISEIL